MVCHMSFISVILARAFAYILCLKSNSVVKVASSLTIFRIRFKALL